MKLSNSFFYTLRENVKDEDSSSGNFLARGGFVLKEASGVYMFMPLGLRVKQKVEAIIRDEMNKASANEVLMPALIPSDIFEKSGRYSSFGSDMFKLLDRNEREFCLGPTHEELFVMAAFSKIKSYKDMPFNIYQIQDKFRDEARPRYGLIRTREFTMKDAYSFDVDEASGDVAYQKMVTAYKNIFDRLGMDYRIVRADTGVMGGDLSEEFQAVTEIGEDVLVMCDSCDFGSNIEVAPVKCESHELEDSLNMELISTPSVKTIDDIVSFLNVSISKTVKTLVYNVDGEIVFALIRGDRELNETKLRKLFGATSVTMATVEELSTVTDATFGFLGPIGVSSKIVVDNEVMNMSNFVCGANKTGYHYINVNLKDFSIYKSGDIVNIKEGDICPKCGGHVYFKKGIEVGNTFKLGYKYSKALGLNYSDKDNNLKPVYMGCYGIGVARCMAAICEQKSDENGLIWPISIAPYTVCIVPTNMKDDGQVSLALKLYEDFNKNGIDVLLDDRMERCGVKFKDMDLIGIPFRITVGRDSLNGMVEFKSRDGKINEIISSEDVLDKVKGFMQN